VIQRPGSKSPDFCRELGDIIAVKLTPHNRWSGFKALRDRWKTHAVFSRIRPALLIDEAQEMSPDILCELRIFSGADFYGGLLLTVVLSGDGRLLELLWREDLVPLGVGSTRDWWPSKPSASPPEADWRCSVTRKAGNASLMTADQMDTLVDRSAGSYSSLMITGAELLAYGTTQDVAQLDEKCYLEVFQARNSRPARK
jgi:hypothetical protein